MCEVAPTKASHPWQLLLQQLLLPSRPQRHLCLEGSLPSRLTAAESLKAPCVVVQGLTYLHRPHRPPQSDCQRWQSLEAVRMCRQPDKLNVVAPLGLHSRKMLRALVDVTVAGSPKFPLGQPTLDEVYQQRVFWGQVA